MDSTVSGDKVSRPVRRSTRQTPVKSLSFEPTPRPPLKRSRKDLENKVLASVNGTKAAENNSEDEEPPSKKSLEDTGGAVGGSGDENEMEVEESPEDMETNGGQEMDIGQDSSPLTHPKKMNQGAHRDERLYPHVALGGRYQSVCSHTANEDADLKKSKKVKSSTRQPAPPTKSATQARSWSNTKSTTQARSQLNRHKPKIPSKEEYRRTMEDKARSVASSLDISRGNHHEKFYTLPPRVNTIPAEEKIVQLKQQEGTEEPTITKRSSGSIGFMWCFWGLVLMLLLGSATLLPYKIIPVLHSKAGGGGPSSRSAKPEKFADRLSLLETQFPSQRSELWKRSKIHLLKHLKTVDPTEPVSLIFTAGRGAERTLRCLAQGVASSFASALNASVLHIDASGKVGQDSDEVKLDIDNQLQAAFEGGKPVAVIHRFEELPPGSTLIFYRYCDHESAAYKRVFLLFTVLLPQNEVKSDQSLKEVEEMVQDYVKERLVGTSSQSAFNEMDTDKYGGLWSRISHLILPVVSEQEVEQKGCS